VHVLDFRVASSQLGNTAVVAISHALKTTGLDRLFDVEPTLTTAVERVGERVPAAV
jgi:hypothetical protein